MLEPEDFTKRFLTINLMNLSVYRLVALTGY